MGDAPAAPELKGRKRQNLDTLMKAKKTNLSAVMAVDEFQEYKEKMAQEFLKESDKAIPDSDHVANIGVVNRVFSDVDEDIAMVKKKLPKKQVWKTLMQKKSYQTATR